MFFESTDASTLVQILPKNIFIAEKTKIRNDK